jgi:hypothetical protein
VKERTAQLPALPSLAGVKISPLSFEKVRRPPRFSKNDSLLNEFTTTDSLLGGIYRRTPSRGCCGGRASL